MAEDNDYSLFKKATQAVSQGTVGDPATSMIDAPGSLGGILPVRVEPKTPSEPAITGEREVTFSKPFFGAAFKETYRNVIDHSQVTPVITVEEAYKARGVDVEGDNFKNSIMQASGYSFKDMDADRDAEGNYQTKLALFVPGESYESRMQKLNAGKAVSLEFQHRDKRGGVRSRTQSIPYSSITEQYTTTPKDLNDYYVNLNPFSDRSVEEMTPWDFFVGMTVDDEVLNVGMARNMVQTLKNNGFSDRNIAGIMKHRMSLPTAAGFGAGDISNFRGVYTDVARFPFEAGGYLLAEGLDAVTFGLTEYAGTWLGPLAAKAEDREEFYDRFFPRMPDLILNRYDQLGLDIDYHQAERLARMFSGIGTKTAALAAETVGATSAAKTIKYAAGKKEINNFRRYETEQRAKYPNITEDEILLGYQNLRRQQLGITFNSTKIHDKILNVPVLGKPVSSVVGAVGATTAAINGLRTSSALKAGMQIEEAALSVSQRPEVRRMITFRNNKRSEIRTIRNRASDEGRPLSLKEQQRIDSLNIDISRSERDLRGIVAESNIPKFMRDSKSLDVAVVLGGATAYTAATAFGGDEMLWEFIGSMGGLTLYGTSKVPRGAVSLVRSMNAGKQQNGTYFSLDLMKAEKLAANLANFDDTFRNGVMQRVNYFNQLADGLRQEGIPSNLLERSASHIINLSVLQTLEEGMRIGLDAPQTAEFRGAMEALEQNKSAQQELIAELRGLFTRLGQSEGAAVEGTAANKLYTTVGAAIESAEGKIQQLDSDLGVLNANYEKVVLGMIEGTPEGSTARIAPGSEASMAQVFDNLNGYGVQHLTPEAAAAMKASIDTKADNQATSIMHQASQTITSALPTTTNRAKDTVSSFVFGAEPSEVQPPAAASEGLPLFRKPGDLLALLLESKHSADKANAALPFKSLNGQIFRRVTPEGEFPVNGAAFADGGPILDGIFDALKTKDNAEFLVMLNPNAINYGPMSKIITTLNDSANHVISQLAAKRNIEPEKVLESIEARAAKNQVELDRNMPRSLAAVNFLRREAEEAGGTLEVLPLNFIQLKELREGVNSMGMSAERAGKGSAAFTFLNLRNRADAAFDRFTIVTPDGERIPANNLVATITMPNGEQRDVTVRQGLDIARGAWTQYKKKYNDEELIRRWMGFDDYKNGARVTTDANADTPLGMSYGKNKPNTWINVEAWAKKSPEQQANDMLVLSNIFGVDTVIDGSTVKRINIDTPQGAAFKEVMSAIYRDFIVTRLERGDLSFTEFEDISRKFESAFVGVNNAGTEIQIVDTNKVFNRLMNFSEGSVGRENYRRGMDMYKNAAQNEALRVKQEVSVVRKGLDSSVRFLQNFSSDRVDAKNLAATLIGGGESRVVQLKQHLKTADGLSDAEINTVLKGVLTEAFESQVFKGTNVYVPNVGNGTIVQKFEVDLQALNTLMGMDNPEVASVVKQIVGEEAYETYSKVLRFMSEQDQKVKTEGVRFTGIPREFSVESYISRFYAINRGVVSFRYVGTEAILQQMRNNNMSMLTQMISNPRVGELFLEMVRTGRPLPADKEKEFFQMLVVGLETHLSTHEGSPLQVSPTYNGEETGYTFTYTPERGYKHLDESFVP